MTHLPATFGIVSIANPPRRERGARARALRLWLCGLVVACGSMTATDSTAGDPDALARWYAPYTQEGNCAPYTRSYGYTPTRWRKWPTAKGSQEPESVPTPRPGIPSAEPSAESSEELPSPESSTVPDMPSEEPGPSTDDLDIAPEPPSNSEPAVPPEMNDSSAKPSQELDELFPDTPPAADDSTTPPSDSSESAPPANDDSSPDAAPGDATPQSRRGGARRTSYESSSTDTKMHWRRSPRLGPNEPADPRTSGDDARVATVGRGRTPSASQESRTATPTARLTSNPLRGTRTVVPTSANPSQSLADTDNVPTTAEVASGSPSWRGNPLRGSQ